jgi:hypothetical protein
MKEKLLLFAICLQHQTKNNINITTGVLPSVTPTRASLQARALPSLQHPGKLKCQELSDVVRCAN